MTIKLEKMTCTGDLELFRTRLVSIYKVLNNIHNGDKEFGGFISDGELGRKFHMNENHYPRLRVTLSESDRRKMEEYSKKNTEDLLKCAETPLERLAVYALWKNADLIKIKHIAAGIVEGGHDAGTNHRDPNAPVFKQFGRHLSDQSQEPIADQHTLRARRYLIDQNLDDPLHQRSNVTAQEVMNYVNWVQGIIKLTINQKHNSAVLQDRLYFFDKSMFALGKATKEFIRLGLPKKLSMH